MKNVSDLILNLSLYVIGEAKDETNFPDKLLLTERQV